MNISSFNPIINNIYKQNMGNERSKFNNLSPLTKDTISFGAGASAKKLVEKFKTYNPNAQYNIKLSEAELIYKYFGYSLGNGSAHKILTGPYGQTYTYSNKSPIDPSNASALIRGIQMADDFNGELILFNKKATDEEIQKWQQIIAERKPTKGFENSYAIDNKERLEALHKKEKPQEIDTTKEQEKTINELKSRVLNIAVSLSQQEEDFEALVGSYEEIKENARINKIEIQQDEVEKVDKQIAQKREDFLIAKSTIETYKDKLSKNNMLTDDEEKNLEAYESEKIDLSNLLSTIEELETLYTNEINKQEQLTEKIINEISTFDVHYEAVSEQLGTISKLIDDATTLTVVDRGTINKLNSLYSTIESKLANIKQEIDDYKGIKQNKTPTKKLNKILNKVSKINTNGLGVSIPEFVEINTLIEKEITPFVSFTDEEKSARTIRQIEKFTRRAEQAQSSNDKNPVEKTKTKTKPKPITTTTQPTVIEESTPIEQKVEISPAEKTVINIQEQRLQEFKSKLTDKISPLPLDVVKSAIAELVDDKYDEMALLQVRDANNTIQNFVKNIATTIANTEDFNRIKNAARFSFLNSVYENSTNKPSEIFNLNGNQSRELFRAIENGQREITIQTNNKPVKISLNNDYDLNTLEKTFKRFNTKNINVDKEIGKKIADEILKYAPSIPEKELSNILIKLSNEGAYYELLLNEDCNETLKTTLLKTFWGNYDSNNGTNYYSQVISKYEAEQKKIKEAEMQKRKLESISNLDWSL